MSTLATRRRIADRRMTDTCRITAPGVGEGTINPVTLERIPPAPTTVYEGICQFDDPPPPSSQPAVGGEAAWDTQDSILKLPAADANAAKVRPGHTVKCLTSADEGLVDSEFGIIARRTANQKTSRRFRIREVVGV